MPDTLGDNFVPSFTHFNPSSSRNSVLPLHVAKHHEQQRRQSLLSNTSPNIELGSLAHEGSSQPQPEDFELDSDDFSDWSGEEQEHDPLDPEQSQMQRRARKQKSKNNLTINTNTKQNGNVANGNGHIDSKMIEHRRKHVVGPEDAKAAYIGREDFSLDQDPPPLTPQTPAQVETSFSDLPTQDKHNFLLLCLLYFLQGIPMGLASGSVPFLLKKYLSYGQIGVFSLAIYPYSLKLLWSPIVDAVWSQRFGRRKSWITPIQTISGLSMIYLGGQIDPMMEAAGKNGGAGVWNFTGWWFLLVFLCATQDIAVDGWAISLLSIQNIAYASTAQTVGLTAGSFLSHTVFLALQAPEFPNTWFRKMPQDYGLLTLGGYMTFWGYAYLVVTLGLAILKKEEKTKERDSIREVYESMWAVLKLKNIITICIIHLIAKLGFVTNDSVTNLKLLDKGFGQANLALVVLIDFPFEIGLGYYAGQWSTKYTPLRLWCWAFVARLAAAIFAQVTVMIYPTAVGEAVPLWYLLTVIVEHVYSTFMNTVMFVAVSAFHARVADPAIGGTYMTLLATVSNLGGTFPKYFVLKLVDTFTSATCIPPTAAEIAKLTLAEGKTPITSALSCALEADKHLCIEGGGTCIINRDGYYITNIVFVVLGAITFWMYIERKALALQALPLRAWRINPEGYTRVNS
ncbi:hypothetical protein LTS08_000563 [Lithohypha guttulata]|uniref:uncharacterized protein n=1 Tax=Lithohypha guttulata TaxID=1690604 RepID=UPI002DDE06CD|nr:hypothetical protein LTR51_006924 [Lithohypha guttulata]KAK5106444.1 hypothetical protein LTS08_000563 [Lithohypha guttulata]